MAHWRNEKGIALVITLLVLTLLITLILEFNNSMRVEARAAANFRDDLKAYYLARAGVTFARTLLEEDVRSGQSFGDEGGFYSGGEAVDALSEMWAQKIPPIPLGDGVVSVEIVDEDRKLNLNAAQCERGTSNSYRRILDFFFSEFELDSDLSCAIRDWMDDLDEECSDNCTGAETNRYRGAEDAYEAKNAPFESTEELRLIQGMDDETYRQVSEFLTGYRDTDPKVNINTAPLEVLLALDPQMEFGNAQAILEYRKDKPFLSISDPGGFKDTRVVAEDIIPNITGYLKVKSSVFSVKSTADVQGVRKTIHAVVKRVGQKTQMIYWRVE